MLETTFQYMQKRDKELRKKLEKNGKAAPEDFSYTENIQISDATALAKQSSKELIEDNNRTIIEEVTKKQNVEKTDSETLEVGTLDNSATLENVDDLTHGGDNTHEKDDENER